MAIRESMAELRGRDVVFGDGTSLHFSSEITGAAKQWLPSPGRMVLERAPAELELPHELQRAIEEHEIIEQQTVHLELQAAPQQDAVNFVPAGGVPDGFARVVLYRDESGGLSWHFPTGAKSLADGSLRGLTAPPSFQIPLRTVAALDAIAKHESLFAERSLLSQIGRKYSRFCSSRLQRGCSEIH